MSWRYVLVATAVLTLGATTSLVPAVPVVVVLVAPPEKVARTVIAPSGSALALMPATVTVVALAETDADPVTVEPPLPTDTVTVPGSSGPPVGNITSTPTEDADPALMKFAAFVLAVARIDAAVGATAPIVNSLDVTDASAATSVDTVTFSRKVPDRSTEHPVKVALDADGASVTVVVDVHASVAPVVPESIDRVKRSPVRTFPNRSLATATGWVPNGTPTVAAPVAGCCVTLIWDASPGTLLTVSPVPEAPAVPPIDSVPDTGVVPVGLIHGFLNATFPRAVPALATATCAVTVRRSGEVVASIRVPPLNASVVGDPTAEISA
jgi:hypothetical protein